MIKGKYIFLLLYILILTEGVVRIGLSITKGASFFHPEQVIYDYYPMLKEIKEKNQQSNPKAIKVLVLSCSTLHKEWGEFEAILEEELNVQENRYTVYNASGVGFSSLDNLNCYKLLEDIHFDYVFNYSAINDSRLSNCPKEVFKPDYRHYKWNNEISSILRHPELKFIATPFFIDFIYQVIVQKLYSDKFIPEHYSQRANWWVLGDDLKSLETFKKHEEEIIKLSNERKEKLLLSSFAYYLPSNYSLNSFTDKKLNYVFQHNSRETEIWGLPDNVARFIESANRTSNSLSQENDKQFIHLYASISNNPNNFADICHFSPSGLRLFAKQVSDAIN